MNAEMQKARLTKALASLKAVVRQGEIKRIRKALDPLSAIYTMNIRFIYKVYFMGIVKISDELHEELRKASSVMARSINSQAEFWIKIGMLAELHPQLSFNDLVADLMKSAEVSASNVSTTEGVANEQ